NALLHKLSAFFANAPLQTVRIRDGLIETAIGTPLLKKLDLRVNMRGTDDALRASGSFSFNGEDVVFAFDREGTATDAQGDSAPVTAKVTSTPLTARFSGKMFTSGDIDGSGELEADLPDIRRLLAWIGVGLPRGDSLQNASANGQVHWTSSTLTFDDGTFEVDGNEAVGLLAITLGERPRVDGTLAFETLILDPYLPDFEPDPSKSDIFDWVLLKHLDADLRLSAAELTARDFKLGGGGFTVTARDGVISSDVGALEICDGYADGRLDLDLSARRTKASLKGRIANADAEPCLKSLGFELPVTGSSTVSVDITTGGKSREQLVRGLAGTISIAAQNGSLPVDLTGLLAEPNAHSSGWSREVGTPYSEVKADCSLSAGHLWCQSFQMTTSKGVIAGAGDLDIADQTLDWDLQMTDGKDLADTAGAEAPAAPEITINGLLAAPSIATVSQTKPQAETPELETEQE
ncbi:MAG: AsmA-like C-terminal region-containing protein, partial [Pseudomonadota bacterium]